MTRYVSLCDSWARLWLEFLEKERLGLLHKVVCDHRYLKDIYLVHNLRKNVLSHWHRLRGHRKLMLGAWEERFSEFWHSDLFFLPLLVLLDRTLDRTTIAPFVVKLARKSKMNLSFRPLFVA